VRRPTVVVAPAAAAVVGAARPRGAPLSICFDCRVQTQVEELADNRVRLTVEVPGHDVKHAVDHAASDLAESLRIPGFRKGRVPMPVLLARVGRERLYAEAVESHIGGWFWNAAARSRVRPVERPHYAYELPKSDRASWSFTATFGVQPLPDVADWTQLEVPRGEVEVPPELIGHELDVLRATVADLAPVEDRPAQPGDTVVLDLLNEDGEAQRGYVAELGGGRLVPELEQGVVGMSAGEKRTVTFATGEDSAATVEITLKEIKEKVLPPLDDAFARAASEFDTLAELRAEVEARLREQVEAEVEAEFRAAAVDALVRASNVEASGPLVETRTAELLEGMQRSLARRGISIDTYLQLTGDSGEELVGRLRAEAVQAVARELVLEAVAAKLGIEVADDEVEQLVREQADAAGDDLEAVMEGLRDNGGLERLREDLRLRNALDRVASEVTPITPELADARGKLWTPEKEKPESPAKLWTPGSKEPA
jgi:trigger factor